jgi:hypothetical protein
VAAHRQAFRHLHAMWRPVRLASCPATHTRR